jgi:predicted GNAT family acetyltransferase
MIHHERLPEAGSDLAAIDITVHHGQRRRGIGTALLRELAMTAGRRNSLFIDNIRAGTRVPGSAGYRLARWTGAAPANLLAS